MIKILRDTCIFAALMILTVFLVSSFSEGITDEIKLVFQLFGLSLIVSVINYLIDEKTNFSILTNYVVKYFVVTGVVLIFGFIVGWFYPVNFWMAFIYVGIITIVVFSLDSVKTEKDIEEINDMVKISKHQKIEAIPLKKKRGWKVLLTLLLTMLIMFIGSVVGYFAVEKYITENGVSSSGGLSKMSAQCIGLMIPTCAATVLLLVLLLVYLTVDRIHRKNIERQVS